MSQKLRLANQEVKMGNPVWSELYPKLQRYCHFLAQNPWDGDDLAQETFMKALRYNDKVVSPSLLNKIAYHHWVDLLRKRKKELLEEVPENGCQQRLDSLVLSIEFLLEQFTPKQAVIFLLKEGFQFQTKEISDLLGYTDMAVKASLHRAKKRLEKRKEEGQEEPPVVKSFWDEEERKMISDLMFESLYEQDPGVLIEAIPLLRSVGGVQQFHKRGIDSSISNTIIRNQTFSPSSTLCMAA